MYNCAALINRLGMKEVRKTYVPNYNEFYERRWWRPAPPSDSIDLIAVNGGQHRHRNLRGSVGSRTALHAARHGRS